MLFRCFFCLCAYILTGGLAAAAEGEPSLAELRILLNRPTVGPAVEIDGPLTIGRTVIELATESKAYAVMAGQTRCGLYLVGGVTTTHTVDDPISRPVAARNLKRALNQKLPESPDAVVKLSTTGEVVIWSWAFSALPERTEEGASPALPEWVRQALDEPLFSPPAMDMIDSLYNDSPNMAYVLTSDGDDTLLLSHDPLREKAETVYLVDRIKRLGEVFNGSHYLHELSSQPIGRSWTERSYGPLVTLKTTIVVDHPGDERVEVSTPSIMEATQPSGLWRTHLRSRFFEGDKILPNTVTKVEVAGEAADFIHDAGELLVRLPAVVSPQQQIAVRVVNGGDFAIHYGGDNFWSLGTTAWYPQPGLDSELSVFDITLRVPEGLEPFASGRTVERSTADGVTTLKAVLDNPMQHPVVAAGKYTVYEETKDGVTCRVATYGGRKDSQAARLINNFFAASGYYAQLFGVAYPFPEVTIIERNRLGFGQAPAGIIFITKEAFDSLSTAGRQAYSEGVNSRFVHEIAHAWWGHVVKINSFDEQWIEEGLAEYSAAVCLEAMRGGGKKGRREFDTIMKEWKTQLTLIDGGGSLFLLNHLAHHSWDDSEDQHCLLYGKSPLVLHALRLELQRHYRSEDKGDQAFFTVWRTLLASFPYRWIETRHMIGILNQITQTDWQPWFDRYVFGTEIPEV